MNWPNSKKKAGLEIGRSRSSSEDRIERTKLFVEKSKKRVGALREEVTRGQVGFRGECPSRWRVAVADIGAGSLRDARTTTPDSSSGFCTRICAIEILCAGTHTGEGRSPIRIIETWFGRETEEDQIRGRSLQEVALGDTLAGATDRSNRGDSSSLMETLIDRAESSVRSNTVSTRCDGVGRRCVLLRDMFSMWLPRCEDRGSFSLPGPPRLVLRGVIPSQGELSARDVVDELPTTVVPESSKDNAQEFVVQEVISQVWFESTQSR